MSNVKSSKGTYEAKIVKVIVTKSTIGNGTKEDPARFLYQYWDLKGHLLAYHDTLYETFT